jgi:hypothetical protein
VFATPVSRAGVADRRTPWKALQAVSVFATPISLPGVANRRINEKPQVTRPVSQWEKQRGEQQGWRGE